MKGLFIPEITAEMFRSGCLESIEALMAEGEIYDIEYEPKRKTGRWVIRETAYESIEAKCSCCGFETLVDEPGNGLHMVNDLHYCPNCGARMEGNNETD